MSADDLIDQLSAEAPRKPLRTVPVSLLIAVCAATFITLALSYVFMAPMDWSASRLLEPVFLIKVAFLLSLLFASLSIVRDLSSPGRKVSLQPAFVLVPFLVLAVLVFDEVSARHPNNVQHALMHQSVITCLWQVGLLALPAFAILIVTVKALAPVNLSRAGLYIGVLSGSIGALGYAFHCHDEFIALVAVSYTLAIVQMGVFGALLGPRLLRWA